MTTTTKVLIALGVVGVGYVVVKQLAPQPKNGVAQVIDSAAGLVKAFTGSSSSAGSTPDSASQTFDQQTMYSADEPTVSYAKVARTQLAPQNTMTRAQAALIGIR